MHTVYVHYVKYLSIMRTEEQRQLLHQPKAIFGLPEIDNTKRIISQPVLADGTHLW